MGLVQKQEMDTFTRYDIFKACKEGDLDTVVALGNLGVDLSISDESGATPLMLAALGGHGDVVSALLAKFKCPLWSNNKNGMTASLCMCRKHVLA